jgi:hypothetical protein
MFLNEGESVARGGERVGLDGVVRGGERVARGGIEFLLG